MEQPKKDRALSRDKKTESSQRHDRITQQSQSKQKMSESSQRAENWLSFSSKTPFANALNLFSLHTFSFDVIFASPSLRLSHCAGLLGLTIASADDTVLCHKLPFSWHRASGCLSMLVMILRILHSLTSLAAASQVALNRKLPTWHCDCPCTISMVATAI